MVKTSNGYFDNDISIYQNSYNDVLQNLILSVDIGIFTAAIKETQFRGISRVKSFHFYGFHCLLLL